MPPRTSLGAALCSGKALKRFESPPSLCLFCSLAKNVPSRSFRRAPTHRAQSTASTSTVSSRNGDNAARDARKQLIESLAELEKVAVNHVNRSRLRLAMQGLRQAPGEEAVRIAVLGQGKGAKKGKTAREVLRLLLADPLKDEAEWEDRLRNHDPSQPLLIKVRQAAPDKDNQPIKIARENFLPEMSVSLPGLNESNLEFLLIEAPPLKSGQPGVEEGLEETVLVPSVEIPSDTDRWTAVATPVHKAIIITEGLKGAVSLASLPLDSFPDTITGVVDMHGSVSTEEWDLPLTRVNTDKAEESIKLIRADIANAMRYETLWYESGMPAVGDALKLGLASGSDSHTKPAVRNLISSVLKKTTVSVLEEESRLLSTELSAKTTSSSVVKLSPALARWAEQAHGELQQQLDMAFTGRKWRKLGWWKLFWRVDDVGMLSSEIITQRFLPNAEHGVIYLAGRIKQAGVLDHAGSLAYHVPSLSAPAQTSDATASVSKAQWPTHITFARNYLLGETIPALQALAQKLVVQSVSTSGLSVALAGLTYLSSFGAYEAGAVASLGLVLSLRHMQKKWETAREFWEGEVREEGRKAVRGVETSVAEVLDRASASPSEAAQETRKLEGVKLLVQGAEEALSRLK